MIAARTPLVALVCLAVLSSACDTGDGKDLQPYDPADYPAPVPPTQVEAAVDTPLEDALTGSGVGGGATAAGPELQSGSFGLTGPWAQGAAIDPRFTCDGDDVAPAVSWSGVPEGTVEIALALFDNSAVSNGQPFVHWVIAGLDPDQLTLAEGDVPPGAVQALNYFGDVGYGGPCPPAGADAHLYRLTAFALNTPVQRADGSLADEFLDDIATATLRSTDLIGTYQR